MFFYKLNTFFLLVYTIHQISGNDIKAFDDTVIFDFEWPGPEPSSPDSPPEPTSSSTTTRPNELIITSSHQEKFKCILPNIEEKETEQTDPYSGPSPLELISPLFLQKSCSYRIESYWTYEICHGKHIRQYHEDKDGKKISVQEFTLGRWDYKEYMSVLFKDKTNEANFRPPVKKIENMQLPYYDILMGNGTVCDLNQNKPRETRVLYVCYTHGKHEVYSFKETSTCMYEVIILSPLVCAHPMYKAKETGEHTIRCHSLANEDAAATTTTKPYNLLKMQVESARRLPTHTVTNADSIRIEFIAQLNDEKDDELATQPPSTEPIPNDPSPVQNFLAGKTCLSGGGAGWWQYEFCYGKSVTQYHEEVATGQRITISLGVFDRAKHVEWLNGMPHKRPKAVGQRQQVSQLYTGGTLCTPKNQIEPIERRTEVKLKCLRDSAKNDAVSLYLLEPTECEYILGVESRLICDILDLADKDGIIDSDPTPQQQFEENGLDSDDPKSIRL